MEIWTWLVKQCIRKKRADKDETETETDQVAAVSESIRGLAQMEQLRGKGKKVKEKV